MIRKLAAKSVILDLKTERYSGLDEVGTRMWQVLMDSASIQAAYEKLLEEYEVTATHLKRICAVCWMNCLENELDCVEPQRHERHLG